MSKNTIPNASYDLIRLGTTMLPGLITYGETLGITQVAPTTFQFALDDFTACQNSFNAFRSAKHTGYAAATAQPPLAVVRGH